MRTFRCQTRFRWQAVGFATLFWGLLAFTVYSTLNAPGRPLLALVFPGALWLVMGIGSLILLNAACSRVTVDDAGIKVSSPIGSQEMQWLELTHVDRNDINDKELCLHAADRSISIHANQFEDPDTLKAEILKHQGRAAQARVVNMAAANKGTILFISLIAVGLIGFGYYALTHPDSQGPKNSTQISGLLFGFGVLLLLCILPTLNRVYISEMGIRKVYFWGTEKRVRFEDVKRAVLTVNHSKGTPVSEIITLEAGDTRLAVSSTIPDFGWVRDMVLTHVPPGAVDDRRGAGDMNSG